MRTQEEELNLAEVIRAADHYAILLTERAEWLLELGIPNFRAYLQRIEWHEDSPLDALESQTGSQIFRHQLDGVHSLDGYKLLIKAPLPQGIRERLRADPTTLNQLMRSCRHHWQDHTLTPTGPYQARPSSQTNYQHSAKTRQSNPTNAFSANALAEYQRLARS